MTCLGKANVPCLWAGDQIGFVDYVCGVQSITGEARVKEITSKEDEVTRKPMAKAPMCRHVNEFGYGQWHAEFARLTERKTIARATCSYLLLEELGRQKHSLLCGRDIDIVAT
jgi:hypothetical protein